MNRYGYDGQLGCAALTFTSTADNAGSDTPDALERDIVPQLEKWLTTNANALPAYAVPRFLRVLVTTDRPDLERDTGADRVSLIMKKLKTGLRQEGRSFLGRSFRVILRPLLPLLVRVTDMLTCSGVATGQASPCPMRVRIGCTGSRRKEKGTFD